MKKIKTFFRRIAFWYCSSIFKRNDFKSLFMIIIYPYEDDDNDSKMQKL